MMNAIVTAPSITSVTQLGYLGLGVSDAPVWNEFATEVLGLQENGSSARGSRFYRMDSHHYRFEICPTGEDDLLWAGWEAKDPDDLAKIAEQVRSLGVKVTEGSAADAAERKVLGLIRFQDPEGLPIEVYHGPLMDPTAFVSPRGVRGFRADALGLGHVVMIVRDLDASLDFYRRGLGVKISDFMHIARGPMRFRVCFTHVNPRHHSLAMGQAMGAPPPAPPGASKPKRLNHFMIELNDFDDVGTALDIFQRRGMPVGQLGRHSNDWMVSFYAPTPSGFSVEYGWNGRSIEDESTWQVQNYDAASRWGHAMPPMAAPAAQKPAADAKAPQRGSTADSKAPETAGTH
jgi:2,3-dihydroxybiphenyl 1,2-dioxygenase